MKTKLLFKVLGVTWITFYTLWLFFGQYVFELGQAFIIFGGAYVAHSVWKKDWVIRFIFFASTNNLYDETLGNPYAITAQEYIIGFLFLTVYLISDKISITTKQKLEKWLRTKIMRI